MMRPGDLVIAGGNVQTTSAPPAAHWPALDGLRGTAVLAVLVCHYAVLLPRTPAVGLLEIGWAGVDLFFVLSGFLITGILLDARGTPNYFRNFYARRVLRIFPLYYGFLAVTLLVSLVVRLATGAPHEGLRHLWAAQPTLWTFTANYWVPAQAAWHPWSEIVIPLWSLSVEEQFYLVWPLVVRRLSERGLARLCVGIVAGALLLRLSLTAVGVDWSWFYFATPARADSLAAGALLALLVRRPGGFPRMRRPCGWAGVVSLVLIIFLNGGFDPVRHPWQRALLYSALAGFFAALVFWSIDAGSWRGIPARLYRAAPLRVLGRYSYGQYILHMPLLYLTILAAKRVGLYDPMSPTWAAGCGLIAANAVLCGAAAVVSFHFYERPFLKLKRRFRAGEAAPSRLDDRACAAAPQPAGG